MPLRHTKKTMLLALALVLSGGVVVYFLVETTRSELHRHENAIADLSEMRHNNHLLDESLLRSRSFHLDDYDSIVEVEGRLRKKCEPGDSQTLYSTSPEEMKALCETLSTKFEAVERFKSTNALVKNSLRYIPELVRETADPSARGRASGLLNLLLGSAAGFRVDRIGERVAQELRQHDLSPELRRQVEVAANAIQARSRTEATIFTPSIEKAIERIQTDYFADYNAESRRSANVRNFLVFACIALGATIFEFFRRLHIAQDKLTDLNLTLESKVHERTVELQTTLDQLRESQSIVLQTTKMSALGEMAGGIAHEINTPLGTILLCAQMIENISAKTGDAALTKHTTAIMTTVRRIAKIVQGLKRFCRDSSRDSRSITNLRGIVDETLVFCIEKFRTNAVDIRVSGDLDLEISCIPEQIGQVVMNLLNNSYDAISGKPTPLWIEVRAAKEDGNAVLYVSDCGPGIPPAVVEKMMQPFYTTKEVGKGTGLGLSISKGIAEAHGGTLAYVSDAPTTTFRLSLPEAAGIREAA